MKKIFFKNKIVPLKRYLVNSYIGAHLNSRSKELNLLRGQRMAIFANDWIGIQLNLFGIYEKDELELLFDFLSPLKNIFVEGVALDIGANIGNHTVFFSPKFNRVYSFEPNQTTFELLRFNSSALKNSVVFNYGLGESDLMVDLYEDSENVGGSSIKQSNTNYTQVKKVSIKKLDDCEIDFDGLCFIKIDVEGAEASVLSGGIETIKKFNPIIVFEQLECEFQFGTTESIEILKSLGYSFCWIQRISKKNNWIFQRFTNLYELFAGKLIKQAIVTSEYVPAGTYSMLIAIPQCHAKVLNI